MLTIINYESASSMELPRGTNPCTFRYQFKMACLNCPGKNGNPLAGKRREINLVDER